MDVLSVTDAAPRMARDALATRASALLWVTAGIVAPATLLLPGVEDDHAAWVLAISVIAFAWAAVHAVAPGGPNLIRWFYLPGTLLAVPTLPALVAATGGIDSPLQAMPIFLIVYATWFYDSRSAGLVVATTTLLALLPFVYDDRASEAESLATTVVLAAGFAATGLVMVLARRELVRLHDIQRDQALRDPLTGLANRRALVQRLEGTGNGRREDDRIGVVLVDLDGFKAINTHHGHAGGDAALVAVAAALQRTARDEDMVARLGGDEFAIVASRVGAADLASIARRVLSAVREVNTELDLEHVDLSASAGVALLPDDAPDLDGVLEAADLALAAAKEAGKDRVLSARDVTASAQSPGAWRN